MALLERLPLPQLDRPTLAKRLPGIRGLLAKQIEEPAIKKLEHLTVDVNHTDDYANEKTLEIVYELDTVAEEVLQDIQDQQYVTLNQVWAAANAWDASRSEVAKDKNTHHVNALMRYVVSKTNPLAAREAFSQAYTRAEAAGTTFDSELDRFNEEERERATASLR